MKCSESLTREVEHLLSNVSYFLSLFAYPPYPCQQKAKVISKISVKTVPLLIRGVPPGISLMISGQLVPTNPSSEGWIRSASGPYPHLAHCVCWSRSTVPASGVWLAKCPAWTIWAPPSLLLLAPLNNHWPCQSCWAEPWELPNGLGPGPPILPDAEMKFLKTLNSGEEEGWSPFLVLAHPKVGLMNGTTSRYLPKRVQIILGTPPMNDSLGNTGKPNITGFLRQICKYGWISAHHYHWLVWEKGQLLLSKPQWVTSLVMS